MSSFSAGLVVKLSHEHECCAMSVPHHGSSKAFPQAVAAWQERLQAGLSQSIRASDQTMGHLEETILRETRAVERALLEAV